MRRVKVSPLSGSNAQLYQHQHWTAGQEKENSLCVDGTQKKIREKFTKKNVKQLHVIQGMIINNSTLRIKWLNMNVINLCWPTLLFYVIISAH